MSKTYTVVKDGTELKELKTLSAAKKVADTEGAEVYCEGECVYPYPVKPETVDLSASTPASTEGADKGARAYRIKALMNIRDKPDLSGEKLGTAKPGSIVNVMAVQDDWLHLADGTYILFGAGKFAEPAQ